MCKVEFALLALSYLAVAGQGRRTQLRHPQSPFLQEQGSDFGPLRKLSLSLLALSPAAAFKGAGLHFQAGKSAGDPLRLVTKYAGCSPCAPEMSIAECTSRANSLSRDRLHIRESVRTSAPTDKRAPAIASVTKLLTHMVVAIFSALIMASPQQVFADETVPVQGSQLTREVVDLLDKYYLDRTFNGVDLKKVRQELDKRKPMSKQEAFDQSVKLVESLGDRYTRILPPGEFKRTALPALDLTGIGINFLQCENGDFIVGQIPEKTTDAFKKGVRFGEVVTTINGKPIRGLKAFDVLDLIEESGDTITLTVRPADGPVVIMVEREVVLAKNVPQEGNPVEVRISDATDGSGKLGYVRLLGEFPKQAKERVQEAFRTLEAAGASLYVLDLRNTRGGLANSAISTASLFVKQPLVARLTDKDNVKTPIFSREDKVITSRPMQVWVDKRTADSAELLAGALRDNCRATIVGTKTSGKGVAQGFFGLSDGSVLLQTVASWSTPSGKEFNEKGIMPDIEREFSSDFWGPKLLDQDLKTSSQDFATDSLKGCQPPAESLRETAAEVQQKLLTAQR